ncbi:MAG: FG-GAP-like repeat-containing protein, partial [Microcoleaceae cyanobacterium]
INLNAPAPAGGITINYQLSGTAKINEDYTVPGDSNNLSVFVPAGATSVILPITTVDDLAKEGSEDAIVTLKTGEGYILIADNNKQTASVNIIDNEQVAINVVNASISDTATNTFAYSSNYNPVLLSETGGVEYLGVRLESKPTSNVTLSLVSSNTSEGDITPANLVFSPDDWNKYQNVTVSAKPDTIYDGDISYQFKVKATSQDIYYHNQNINLAAKTIDDETKLVDNTTIPEPVDPSQLPIASISLIKAPTEKETGTIAIKLSKPLATGSEPVIVLLEATDGSAILNTDYYFPGQNAFVKGPSSTINNLKIGTDSQITLGDLDKDGDLDIVEGTANGEIKYHENLGNSNFQEKLGTNNPFHHVKLTGKIAPTLADLNGDQKLDLIVKDSQGQIHYQINKSDEYNSIFLNTANYQKPITANTTEAVYQAIFSVKADTTSFNPTTVTIAGTVLPVKNLRENKETGTYYFDVETTDAKLAETLTAINYDANQLVFDSLNNVTKIVWRSAVTKTETIK